MSSKMNKMCGAATVEIKSLGNYQHILRAHDMEHKGITKTPSKKVILSIDKDDIIDVKLRRAKDQKRTSPITNIGSGLIENKKGEKRSTTSTNNSETRWGNVFRQNLLRITEKQSSKHNENGKTKKNINVKNQQKTTVKHPIRPKENHLKTPCCSTVLVQDRDVQCEIYNSNKFAEFNPIHMLCLIKQLQDLVNKKDERTCEIFTEMEQILQKIPKTKVESSAVPLKESDKMKAMSNESFILEQEKLQSEIPKRDERSNKIVDQKYSELHVQMLTQQFNEVIHEKDSMITGLKQEITDLKTKLNKQTELTHKNYIDCKCLTMEVDKLSALSSYKDKQIIDYRNTVKELQNQIAKQLKIINEMCIKEDESTSPHISVIHTGYACSSPTSSFSDDSNKSWHDLSDISSVDSVPEERTLKNDAPIKDFISLLDEESSRTIMPDQNEVMNNKGSATQNNENNTVPYQNVNTNNVTAIKSLHHSSEKDHNKKSDDIYKTKKFTRLKENQNSNTKNLFLNASKALESVISTKSISDIRKQDNMQHRKPVNVPSPLRDCPHPDWSDSSLPSISTISNLDMVPSNDV